MGLKSIYKQSTLLKINSWSAINFQNGSSPLIEQLNFFHNHTMTILILIIIIVTYNIITTYLNKNNSQENLEAHELELFWTFTPTFILFFIGMPSIRLLYLIDEVYKPIITIKTLGHQWYWSYEYTDVSRLEFDSFMSKENRINRLLQVDNNTLIPIKTQVRNLISSADVLHSWALPSLGVKADAVPGRLNQVNFYSNITGLKFGQCSEICGANHRFIPIVLESTSIKNFINWLKLSNKSLGGWIQAVIS